MFHYDYIHKMKKVFLVINIHIKICTHSTLVCFSDLLDEARDYHLMPERRSLLQSFRIKPRCCNYIMGHIFAVGGLAKTGNIKTGNSSVYYHYMLRISKVLDLLFYIF